MSFENRWPTERIEVKLPIVIINIEYTVPNIKYKKSSQVIALNRSLKRPFNAGGVRLTVKFLEKCWPLRWGLMVNITYYAQLYVLLCNTWAAVLYLDLIDSWAGSVVKCCWTYKYWRTIYVWPSASLCKHFSMLFGHLYHSNIQIDQDGVSILSTEFW